MPIFHIEARSRYSQDILFNCFFLISVLTAQCMLTFISVFKCLCFQSLCVTVEVLKQVLQLKVSIIAIYSLKSKLTCDPINKSLVRKELTQINTLNKWDLLRSTQCAFTTHCYIKENLSSLIEAHRTAIFLPYCLDFPPPLFITSSLFFFLNPP